MPSLPYPISGKVTKVTGTVSSSGTIYFKNYTQGGRGIAVDIDSNGNYVTDLNNFENSIAENDVVQVFVKSNGYYEYSTFTVGTEESKTLNLTTYGLRQYVYLQAYALITANLGSAWTVRSMLPGDIAEFPCAILAVFSNANTFVDLSNSNQDIEVVLSIEYYSKTNDGTTMIGKGYLDEQIDKIRQSFIDNQSTLDFKGMRLSKDTAFDESNVEKLEFNGNVLHVAMQKIKLVVN